VTGAAQAPEQIRISVLGSREHTPVHRHNVDGQDVVDRGTEAPGQVADTAAQGEPGSTGLGDHSDPTGCRCPPTSARRSPGTCNGDVPPPAGGDFSSGSRHRWDPWVEAGWSLIVRRVCRRAGIAVVGAHALRHTLACELVAGAVGTTRRWPADQTAETRKNTCPARYPSCHRPQRTQQHPSPDPSRKTLPRNVDAPL